MSIVDFKKYPRRRVEFSHPPPLETTTHVLMCCHIALSCPWLKVIKIKGVSRYRQKQRTRKSQRATQSVITSNPVSPCRHHIWKQQHLGSWLLVLGITNIELPIDMSGFNSNKIQLLSFWLLWWNGGSNIGYRIHQKYSYEGEGLRRDDVPMVRDMPVRHVIILIIDVSHDTLCH